MVITAAMQSHDTEHPLCWVSAEPLASPGQRVFGIAVLTQVDTQVDTVKLCKKQTSDRVCERQCCSRGTLFSLQLEYDVAIRLQTGASAQVVWMPPGQVGLGSLEQRMGQMRERCLPRRE